MPSAPQQYYRESMSRALAHIDGHLKDDIRVADLAKKAHLSAFHFQRIFKSLCGESPYEMILRKRLEKAVFLLRHRKNMRITAVAETCGFKSLENFSRQFKARFGQSPSRFFSDDSQRGKRIYQEINPLDFYKDIEQSRNGTSPAFNVILSQIPRRHVALIRAIFGSDASALIASYHRLMKWHQKTHPGCKANRIGMSIDDPAVTPAGKYRYDFAVVVDESFEASGEIQHHIIPAGLFASIHCQGSIEVVAQAWDFLYQSWLPKSGYVPVHHPALEIFIRGPEEIGWDQFDLKCGILLQPI